MVGAATCVVGSGFVCESLVAGSVRPFSFLDLPCFFGGTLFFWSRPPFWVNICWFFGALLVSLFWFFGLSASPKRSKNTSLNFSSHPQRVDWETVMCRRAVNATFTVKEILRKKSKWLMSAWPWLTATTAGTEAASDVNSAPAPVIEIDKVEYYYGWPHDVNLGYRLQHGKAFGSHTQPALPIGVAELEGLAVGSAVVCR